MKCPGVILTNKWESILVDELPDDAVAEMEMEDDLRKLKLPKGKDPKELLADMAAIEVQYKYRMTDIRKVAVVLRAGEKD